MTDKKKPPLTDVTGRWQIQTDITLIDCKRLDPRNDAEVRAQEREGPLYRIVASLDKYEEALERKTNLLRSMKGHVRVNIVPAQSEQEALACGEFRIIDLQQADEQKPQED